MEKKRYHIEISGESYGDSIQDLTEEEAALIKDIFEDCESEYISCKITEIPDIDYLMEEYKVCKMKEFDRGKLIQEGITDEFVLGSMYEKWLHYKYNFR